MDAIIWGRVIRHWHCLEGSSPPTYSKKSLIWYYLQEGGLRRRSAVDSSPEKVRQWCAFVNGSGIFGSIHPNFNLRWNLAWASRTSILVWLEIFTLPHSTKWSVRTLKKQLKDNSCRAEMRTKLFKMFEKWVKIGNPGRLKQKTMRFHLKWTGITSKEVAFYWLDLFCCLLCFITAEGPN